MSAFADATLVIFARPPIAGRVKTRLAGAIGEAPAAELYGAFLEDTCALTAGLDVRRVLAVDGHGAADHPAIVAVARAHELRVVEQAGGDLGARLDHAITVELAASPGPVCVIGSDAPALQLTDLHAAFVHLHYRRQLVLGPATDGGYWLLGTHAPVPELLREIPWSTRAVLPETLRRLRGREVKLLPFRYDVDDADDLALLAAHLPLLPKEVAPATRRALAALGLL